MNVSESDIPGDSLKGWLPAYEADQPRFDATPLLARDSLYAIRILRVATQPELSWLRNLSNWSL